MDRATYKNNFDDLYNEFISAHHCFYTLKALRKDPYRPFYERWHYLWDGIFESLQINSLRSLGIIYEQSSFTRQGTALSIFTLLPHHPDQQRAKKIQEILDTNSDLIRRIKQHRDNRLSHKNITRDKPLEEINYNEIEELIKLSTEVVSFLNPEEGIGYDFRNFEENQDIEARAMFEGLKYYKQKFDKWMKKFVEGEVNSPKMPDDF